MSVSIFILHLGIKGLIARSQDNRPYLYFYLLRYLTEIYGLILTYGLANTAFLLFQVNTALIYIRDQGNCLGKVDMDGFILRYVLIKLIRVFDRAVLDTGSATRAFLLENIPGLLKQGYLEVSLLPFYTVNFRIGQDFYIGMPADLDQFG